MTTVVYKDGVLCSDSQSSIGDTVYSHHEQKIWVDVGPFAALAICGNPQGALDIIQMIDGYTKIDQVRGIDFREMEINTQFIVITKDGELWNYAGKDSQLFQVDVPFAMGSGAQFALGAMGHGATAEEALLVAANYDVYTNSVIQKCVIAVDEEGVTMDIEETQETE